MPTLARTPADDLKTAEAEMDDIKDVTEDFLEHQGLCLNKTLGKGQSAGRRTVGELMHVLRGIARRKGAGSKNAAGLLERLQTARTKVADLHRARETAGVASKAHYGGATTEATAAKADETSGTGESAEGRPRSPRPP